MKKKVHIVHHTHWDREWYFTSMDALLLSDNLFSDVITELVSNPEAKFCLDGQSSILEDYVSLHPENIETIKKLVKSGQLAIGPWYTQTDGFFVNEESFIRNLMIGVYQSRKYGSEMKIGYLPDSFGFNAQMPTILANCGFDNMIFWRGLNLQKHTQSPYFKWKGLGNKAVTAINLVDGYGTAAFLRDSKDYIEERLLPAVKRVEKWTDLPELLIPSGGDQLDIIPDLPKVLEAISQKTDYDFIDSSYEDFREFLRKQEDLPEYKGEFREPCTTRAHKSIGSVRYDIKRQNFLIEQKLLKRVEPLLGIASKFDIKISTQLLITAWENLLKGHAHDSMGGCVMDTVAADILHRFKEADELADGIENYIVKRLSEKLGLTQKQVLVFNTTSKDFEGCKVIDFLCADKKIRLKGIENAVLIRSEYFKGKDNLLLETPEGQKYVNEAPYYRLYILAAVSIPSMGFKVYDIETAEEEMESLHEVSDTQIQNEHYTLFFGDKELTIQTAEGKIYQNFLEFEDMANDGDTYDFSPLEGDSPKLLNLEFESSEKSSLYERLNLKGKFLLPKTLDDRLLGNGNGNQGELELQLSISLLKNSPLIECKLSARNEILSHRLRAKINTGLKNTTSIASVPFGFIKREALTREIPDWFENYVEYPIDLEPYDKSVSVGDSGSHISCFGKGIKEYQFQNSFLYLTLFASTGQLGKPNLAYRPGRASGDTTKIGHIMMPTPMAELLGSLEFEFAFVIEEAAFDNYEASAQWENYTSQDICYQNQSFNMFIHRLDNKIQPQANKLRQEREFSLLNIGTKAFDSTFMPSLNDEGAYLLRLSNPTGQPLPIGKINCSQFSKLEFVNCVEEKVSAQKEIEPYDMVTLKLWS